MNITFRAHTGTETIDVEGDVGDIGTVWYDPTSLGNVIGFAHLAKKYRVTYDSEQEDAFAVHLPGKVIKFHGTSEGLYAYRPSDRFRELVAAIQTPTDRDLVAQTVKNLAEAERRRQERINCWQTIVLA